MGDRPFPTSSSATSIRFPGSRALDDEWEASLARTGKLAPVPRHGGPPADPATAPRANGVRLRPPRCAGSVASTASPARASPRHEGLDDGRVELRARAAAELGERELLPGRLAVGPVGGHRLEGVGDEDDRATRAGSVAGQAVGVAAAVEALVVVAHPARLDSHVGGLDDVVAEQRVALHLLVLGVGELGRLVEDRVGDPDLADVVQQAGQPQARRAARRRAELGADQRACCDTVWQWLRVYASLASTARASAVAKSASDARPRRRVGPGASSGV